MSKIVMAIRGWAILGAMAAPVQAVRWVIAQLSLGTDAHAGDRRNALPADRRIVCFPSVLS